jgi:DNA-binding NarL/FixJ family response regulator
MPSPPLALLVMPPGAARRQVESALGAAGLTVRAAAEPYEASVALADGAPDLVVLDLGAYRRRDAAFLAALKRRAPAARTLLLLPEGMRRRAIHALRAGADAYVLEPADPDEVGAVARALLRRAEEPLTSPDVRRLCRDIQHVVSNPLQVLALWGESPPKAARAAGQPDVREPVYRIRDVMTLLAGLGGVAEQGRQPWDLGKALAAALESAAERGVLRPLPPPPAEGPVLTADSGRMGQALAMVLGCLAGLSSQVGTEVSASVTRPAAPGEPITLDLLAHGVRAAPSRREELLRSVVLGDERQGVYPGLAYAAAAVRGHGGTLTLHEAPEGLRVRLTLPG